MQQARQPLFLCRLLYFVQRKGLLQRICARTRADQAVHCGQRAYVRTQIMDNGAYVGPFGAGERKRSFLRGLVKALKRDGGNDNLPRRALDLNAFPRKVIQPLPIYLHGGVHRRLLELPPFKRPQRFTDVIL